MQTVHDWEKMNPGVRDKAALNGLVQQIRICDSLLRKFKADSEKHTRRITTSQNRPIWNRCAKIRWHLFHSGDVVKLDGELRIHLGAINLFSNDMHKSLKLLMNAQCTTLSQLRADSGKTTALTTEFLRRIEAYLVTIQAHVAIPKAIGYTWEGDCLSCEAPIKLINAFGRVHIMPLCLLRSFQVH
ncbi:Protein of unknown function [Pyronema omphalodes CBS 100304]|uniref:Uncharacterized protein n=1 Tax=Pyronema omphalodes (strain CBS 100304) TaxID=1076935 RepID=U4KUW9_PYROM|nr:Protein of unknown function [Pyronema omphalodes CBS 100304]